MVKMATLPPIQCPEGGVVVFLGDIHSDPWALLEALSSSNAGFFFSDALWKSASTCHHPHLLAAPAPPAEDDVKTSKPVSVVFLGDLTDGRRGKAETLGGCGNAHTLGLTLKICNQVARACKQSGGRCVLVLGNHDMGNLGADSMGLCKNYAHATTADSSGIFSTCTNEGVFAPRHSRMVRNEIDEMEVGICAAIDDFGLAVHGFISQEQIAQVSSELRLPLPRSCVGAANLLNSAFSPLFDLTAPQSAVEKARLLAKQMHSNTPWWCRPTLAGVTPLPYCKVLVKGHCVAQPGTSVVVNGCRIYFADCAMSAAFNNPSMVAQSLVMNSKKNFVWHIVHRRRARVLRVK